MLLDLESGVERLHRVTGIPASSRSVEIGEERRAVRTEVLDERWTRPEPPAETERALAVAGSQGPLVLEVAEACEQCKGRRIKVDADFDFT